MKRFLLFSLLLAAACTRYEVEYTVNCRIDQIFFGSKVSLVVTDNDGDVLHTFDLPSDATNFTGSFPFSSKNPAEIYDLHLMAFDTLNICLFQFFSHFDVPNGAPVFFAHDPNFFPFVDRVIPLHIYGVESFDSVYAAGDLFFNVPLHFPEKKKVETFLFARENQGFVVHLRANGEQEFRHLYLPESLLQNTVSVDFQDFKTKGISRSIEMPGGGPVSELEVTAVSPDFKKFTHLRRFFSWLNSGIQEILPQFTHPEGLAEPATYRVRAVQTAAEFEKIFQPGEPLRFETANMEIGKISAFGNKISIETSGNIDMLRINISSTDAEIPGCVFFWQMEGKPESFKNRTILTLDPFLPGQPNISQALAHGVVRAMQFDKYGYEQVREGFPFRLEEPFAVARSGYKAVFKSY